MARSSGYLSDQSSIIRRRPSRLQRILVKILVTLLSLMLIASLALLWAFKIEPDLLTVTRLTITDENLPENWDGRVVAFFTDIHVGESYSVDLLDKVARAVNKAKPDLVLLGGDLVDHRTPTDDDFSDAVSAVLGKMEAKYGKFAIVGNHDNRLRAELKIAVNMLENGGFKMLVNESAAVDGILVGGLDESYFGKPDLDKTFPADSTDWRLLLMHQPDFAANDLPADSARLLLSGHTHNGQVTFFGKPISTVYQGHIYTYGRYRLDDGRQLVVSRGLGTIGLRARFCSPPELMLITLRRQ